MNKIYISKNYFGKNTAESKAKIDCEKILSLNGYHNAGLHRTTFQNRTISSILTVISSFIGRLRMPRKGIVVLQYPKATIRQEIKTAIRKKSKVVIIIHDLETLRGFGAKSDSALSWAKDADVLIVHTEKMANYIRDILPNKKIIILGIFDYLCIPKSNICHEENKYIIAFAGNLTKSLFLSEIDPKKVKFNLFGPKDINQIFHNNLIYKGVFSPEDLLDHLDAHFGLVWDGDINGSGKAGDYLRYISPHKLSMYISAGIPIIIKKDSAMADFVLENRIGIVLDSLLEIDDVIPGISKSQYMEMKNNVKLIQDNISKGHYLSLALETAESFL